MRLFFAVCILLAATGVRAESGSLEILKSQAQNIETKTILDLPVRNGGRLKPFLSFSREAVLFITGRYSRFGISAEQLYLALASSSEAEKLDLIDVREPSVRETLGLTRKQKHYSLMALEASKLESLVPPLMQKASKSEKLLNSEEKAILEVYHQVWTFKKIQSGEHLIEALDFGVNHEGVATTATQYLQVLHEGRWSDQSKSVEALRTEVLKQEIPASLKGQEGRMQLEVLYVKSAPFFWAAVISLILGAVLISGFLKGLPLSVWTFNLLVPIALVLVGLGIRVMITGFAPVTNMYGTMIWVGLGVQIFTLIILLLYKNLRVTGILTVGSGLVLWMTESLPLTLNPGLDPIVAVLRSNYWLTIHVLTITISYAAFTIAALLGNVALVMSLLKRATPQFLKEYAHYCYRMIQLGCFLLTVGIILGGIWADYSWGRFWGWDPKETWALIADVGFLAILHARFVGWLREFGTLAASTAAYLLVIMAWYGVNFILAAGLHSYGFSSGGAAAVVGYVSIQVGLLSLALWDRQRSFAKKST